MLSADGKDTVASLVKDGAPGAMSFSWDGAARGGGKAPSGRYLARLVLTDADGRVVQTEDVPFVRDTLAAQERDYSQIGGSLALPNAQAAANAPVELVDGDGNVVARTRSTQQGMYNFKNVAEGKYKVRVSGKAGFRDVEAEVDAKKAEKAGADLKLK